MRSGILFVLVSVLAFAGLAAAEYPPIGKPFRCPVSGRNLVLEANQPYVEFEHGQRVWFGSVESATRFAQDPLRFARDGADPVWPYLPDVRHEVLTCPVKGEPIGEFINGKSPRVQLKYGQSVYLFCFESVNKWLSNPRSFIKSVNGRPPAPVEQDNKPYW